MVDVCVIPSIPYFGRYMWMIYHHIWKWRRWLLTLRLLMFYPIYWKKWFNITWKEYQINITNYKIWCNLAIFNKWEIIFSLLALLINLSKYVSGTVYYIFIYMANNILNSKLKTIALRCASIFESPHFLFFIDLWNISQMIPKYGLGCRGPFY